MDEQFIKDVVLGSVNKCGNCGHLYEQDNVSVVAHEEGLWLMMMNCPACGSRGLLAALVKDQAKAGPIIEVTEKELEGFRTSGVVSSDDVLDMHEFLRDFDGDFAALFNKRR